jgi:ElaA protein
MQAADIAWQHTAFDALSVHQLYAILRLRTDVFVMEQNCAFQDMDGFDAQAVHLMGYSQGKLVAYARCFPAGVKFKEASIGRVITSLALRGQGAGPVVMQQAISCVEQHWGVQPIRIGAQAHLDNFYGKLGFIKTGAPYIEDNIPHIEMLRT